MRKHTSVAFALLAVIASRAQAIEKDELRHRYPTIEAAAHAFGALDVNHTEEHSLIVTASFPPRPGQWSGMVTYPEEFQGEEASNVELDHAIIHNGRMLDHLESAFRPDITVWDDPVAKISRGKMRYRIGTVHEDLRVEVFPELRDAFPGEYIYIPATDEVYESPFALPRIAYTRLAFRRQLSHGDHARFALSDGSRLTMRIGVVRHFGDDRRFLVGNFGKRALVLGEMYPFANPETGRQERCYWGHQNPTNRNPEFALFNELAGFEVQDHPIEPADPTIIYGAKIYPRFLHHFDVTHGPILRAEEIRGESAHAAAGPTAKPAPGASPSPAASASPAAKGLPAFPDTGEASPSPGASPDSGGITPVPAASGDAGAPPPPPPADASAGPPPPPPDASAGPPPPPPSPASGH